MTALFLTVNSAGVEAADAGEDEADDAGEEAIFPLPQLIVQGKKVDAPPSLIVREVGIEDMVARNAHTVGEALIYVPGVNVQVGGTSGDARAWIRGYRDRDVLVLFNGIPVATGFEGTIDLNEIAVQRVATIKVLKSAPSVVYGTNGVGGVIDVVPESGVTESFLDGRLEFGSDDRAFVQASGGGGNGNLSYALSVQYQQADDYSLSDDYVPELNQPAGDRVNSDFERGSLFLQLDAQETPIGHTSLFLNMADADKGLAIETGVDDPAYERLTNSRRNTLGFSNDFVRIPLSLNLYYNAYDSELTAYTDDSFTEVDDIESAEDYALGGKLYSILETSGNNKLILTAGGQNDVFKGEGELEDGNKAELTTWTLAAEDEFWITEKLSLAAGGIFVYFDQTLLDRSSNAFNPQLALAWQATPRLSLHASVAERTRFPKLRELYRRRFGNPDLEPQTAINYEAGVMFQHKVGWTSDFAVFHSDIDGLIERADRRALYTNFDTVKINGIEAATSYWISDAFLTRLGYTYVDAEEDVPGGGSRQLRSRPKHTVVAELRYSFPHAVLVSFSGIYVSHLYDLDPEDTYTELSSYFVANIKASWAFSDRYEAYLSLSNLGDTDYLQRLGDPREGRAFLLGLSAGF
ncbi:MAG TPA: TonB-dependent receptor [Xanthomonadales bacterium]|nr:TonB-dependent receptor [Xanthomonadales bacterium]